MEINSYLKTAFIFAILYFAPVCFANNLVQPKEAYFNGSAYLRLFPTMPVWSLSAISLRSCQGGKIFSQSYGGHTLQLEVGSDSVVLSLLSFKKKHDVNVPAKLLDNRWHTVKFVYQFGNLNMILDRQSVLIANSTYNSIFLTNQEIKNDAAVLIIGQNYSGCLLHGPGLVFNMTAMNIHGVVFGSCPLADGKCGSQEVLVSNSVDYCIHDPCMQHGKCISRAESYECHCTARYSGKNCEVDAGPPCASQPCHNGGSCREDERGDYKCYCPATFTGIFCEHPIVIHPLCEKNPCLNNGTCQVSGNNHIECICANGFTGDRCEIDWNECESQPCQNEGRCIDQIGGFRCECLGTGYSGTVCQTNIDECLINNPCLNNGICFDTYGSYTCECPSGFMGNNCEQQANDAAAIRKVLATTSCPPCPLDSECINGKCICKPGTTGTVGHCKSNYKPFSPSQNHLKSKSKIIKCTGRGDKQGINCETPVALPFADDCHCLNGGTCEPNSTDCVCPLGYEGINCEVPSPCSASNCLDPMKCISGKCICPENVNCALGCASSPCTNGATCHSRSSEYYCQCPSGYNGTNCETDIDECVDPKLCGNGICVNYPGSFRCYCEPGFTGVLCDKDVDECLSRPCKNDANCINKVNDFECICPPGYDGKDCGNDINECESQPCFKGSTCIDLIANFSCQCITGMTGRLCDLDIDDCASAPCLNGHCIDRLGGFECDCTKTGFTGNTCEININECAPDPCKNGAECVDLINDYQCRCYPGYDGKNCENDVNECEKNPCQYNGTCLEKSNYTLYTMAKAGVELPPLFSENFSYENAIGYECICVPGITGKNCEININECESSPCKFGNCVDGVGDFTCECDPGFEGVLCEREIDECEVYKPCKHGTCNDRRDNYDCDCDLNWGGKNCSVALIGCEKSPCLNNGICIPFVVNEVDHRFNCTCADGFQGQTCDKVTTFSMATNSLITVNTSREEGYEIHLQFRTTLPNGILAFGNGNPYSYILELVNGRLNLHSSLLNKWEGVFIGSGLNDSLWQKVFVAINSSHLVLSANEEQTIYPINQINSYEGTNASHTSFPVTYLGGTIPHLSSYLRHLTHAPSSFVGCMQDVVINGKWVFPQEPTDYTSIVSVEAGCPRATQCDPNPCYSNGLCMDLWHTFSCTCQRPHLGPTCKYNMTAATFGNENTTHSAVVVKTSDIARRAIRSVLDISMFIRTRQSSGQIFYIGSERTTPESIDSSISASLTGGELLVKIHFNGTPEAYTVGGNKLDNGYTHLIEVIRNHTLVQVKLNGTEYFRKTLSSTGQLNAQKLYLAGPPPEYDDIVPDNSNPKDELDKIYFKGIIQDVQVSNGSYTMGVQFYPLNAVGVIIPPPFGDVTIDTQSVLEGEVTDDLCRQKPCNHGAECRNTWNDFECICPRGYKGKLCQDIQFCELQKCPGNSLCQNLDDGYECVTNMTFHGDENEILAYYFEPGPHFAKKNPFNTIEIKYRTKTGGTLLVIQNGEMYFEIAVYMDQVTIQWRLSTELPETKRFHNDGHNNKWHTLFIRIQDGNLEAGWKGWELTTDPTPLVAATFDVNAYNQLLSRENPIYLGGINPLDTNTVLRGTENGKIYKGCLGEARIGSYLLPYFPHYEIYPENFNTETYFVMNSTAPKEGCVLCFQKDCKNGGVCVNPSEEYSCKCPEGYDNDDCSNNIDECVNAKCTNNSTCIDGIANYTCLCLPGYEGNLCETEINECESNPCKNGGSCIDLIGNYSCVCQEDYIGNQCESLKLVTCDNQPCFNGSTCTDGFNAQTSSNFTCSCTSGMTGKLCDTPFCFIEQCQNGGFCLTTEQIPICQCSYGYSGRLCETEINECDSNPCQNGGKCIDIVGNYRCDCSQTGYEGVDCEIDINECAEKQITCGGTGTCLNTQGSFKCVCQPGVCGIDCNLEDPCSTQDICKNNGVCEEKCTDVADYECRCAKSFIGKNCTEVAMVRESETSPTDIAIIVVPIVIGILALAAIFLGAFLMMARNKRATRGTYSPSAQEYCNPRLEMDNVLKPPPEERLI